MEETKKCSICGIEKPLTDFYYRKDTNNYHNKCKKCYNGEIKNKELYDRKKENEELLLVGKKRCSKCGLVKDIEEFQLYNNRGKYIRRADCKECNHKQSKEWELLNKEYRKEYKKKYEEDHIEEITQKRKERFKKYGKEITAKRKPYQDEYREKNREKLNKQKKEYYQNNKDEILTKMKETRQTDKYKERVSNYTKKRQKEDKVFATTIRVRKLLFRSFSEHGFTKNKRATEIIGCSFDEFYNHLIQSFKNNYGYDWDGKEPVHIDHIKPLATAKTEEDIIKLCHYTNLQLLKASDNMSKKDSLEWKVKKD